MIRFEWVLYHPQSDRFEEEILASKVIGDPGGSIDKSTTMRIPLNVTIADPERVLIWAMRRLEGDVAPLSWSTFTLRGTRGISTPISSAEPDAPVMPGGEARLAEDADWEFSWTIDISTHFSGVTAWVRAPIGHIGGVALRELLISWGDFDSPEGVVAGTTFA